MAKTSPRLTRGLGLAAAASLVLVPVLSRRLKRAGGRHGRKVREVMIPDVLTVDGSATVVEAAQKMQSANVGVLPVVEDGVLRGLVTDRDLVVRALARGANPATTRVAECATRDIVCARPETTIDEAREVMADYQVGRLPVVDEANHVIGIVTLGSLALRSRGGDETLRTATEVSRRSARG
jgi:CBS domain-containing protein